MGSGENHSCIINCEEQSHKTVSTITTFEEKGEPKLKTLDKIQRMINCLAHFICKAPKSAHITPSFTISTGYQSAVLIVSGNGLAPPYLSDLLHRYSPSPLSCGYSDLRVHKMGRRTLAQERFFQFEYIEPVIENSLSPTGICFHSSFFFFFF